MTRRTAAATSGPNPRVRERRLNRSRAARWVSLALLGVVFHSATAATKATNEDTGQKFAPGLARTLSQTPRGEPLDFAAVCRQVAIAQNQAVASQQSQVLLVSFSRAVDRAAAEQLAPTGYRLGHLGFKRRTASYQPSDQTQGTSTSPEITALQLRRFAAQPEISSIAANCAFRYKASQPNYLDRIAPKRQRPTDVPKLSASLSQLVRTAMDENRATIELPRVCNSENTQEELIVGIEISRRKDLPSAIGNLQRHRATWLGKDRFVRYRAQSPGSKIPLDELFALADQEPVQSLAWQCSDPQGRCAPAAAGDFTVNSCSQGASLCARSKLFSDPRYQQGNQWYLERIGAPAIWHEGIVGSAEPVAVLDNTKAFGYSGEIKAWNNPNVSLSSCDSDHSDHGCDILCHHDDYPNTWCTAPGENHGEMVGYVLAARGNNGIGGVGVAPGAPLLAVRTFTTNHVDALGLWLGLDFAVRYSRVINLSQRVTGVGADAAEVIADLVEANDQALFVVAAADTNHVLQDLAKTSETGNILVVYHAGRTGSTQTKAAPLPLANEADCALEHAPLTPQVGDFSKFDLAAPVDQLCLPIADTLWDTTTGSSFATPQVAAAAALVWSQSPELSGKAVAELLKTEARPYESAVDSGDHTPILLNLRFLLEGS